MAIAPDRLDKFTFQGEFRPVTDPEENDRINKKIGFVPPSDEEWAWVSAQWKKRWRNEPGLSTDKLQAEYARKKALGQL
ncbi:hypothetical protein KIH79_09260 [Bifidobacterium sp. 82T10]|uniref:Uncharacterized protein n=1 Tax=Bifidobacterium miconis TaxID=2834435 RepID=A0ABS6WGC1_9BIFI|nr:hypothetical protein [Bifidobacterium miconis]MBW3093104.1 hypothetical protein [Bifidobacterium miconis]